MAEIRFYHLQTQTPGQALITLLERARQKGEPLLIQAQDKTEMEQINAHLWTYQAESFLPHETTDSKFAATQSILISCDQANVNKATMMFQLHPGEIHIPEGITLCCKIFDGANDSSIMAARAEWRRLKDSEHSLTYWQQDEAGKWEQKA